MRELASSVLSGGALGILPLNNKRILLPEYSIFLLYFV
jgi:hypothetical protein